MHNFLATLKTSVLKRAAAITLTEPLTPNTLDFCKIFSQSNPAIIAELKFARPGHGQIYPGTLDPVTIANAYVQNGATALSILTEPDYFKGKIDFMGTIRQALPQVPLLLKDFILEPIQIAQARVYGANAVLLIVAFIASDTRLAELYAYTLQLGMTPLIEVHNATELAIALRLAPPVIGINNRNLHTLKIDLNTSRQLIAQLPATLPAICESGLQTSAELQEMQDLGFKGFLIGSQLMQHPHPGEALHTLLQGAKNAR